MTENAESEAPQPPPCRDCDWEPVKTTVGLQYRVCRRCGGRQAVWRKRETTENVHLGWLASGAWGKTEPREATQEAT